MAQRTDPDVADSTRRRGRLSKRIEYNDRYGNTPEGIAKRTLDRYAYVKDRGFLDYAERARKCERMYLGGGLQWDEEDKAWLEETDRHPLEINETAAAVDTAIGYQINNRVDITVRPRGQGADEATATAITKLLMQVADNVGFHDHETDVFGDGLIQERGYYELRMTFDDTLHGEIDLGVLDPLDVIPDPDGKQYDPDTWSDVLVTRWLTIDEIESLYGEDARAAVEEKADSTLDANGDFGEDMDEVERNKFGENDFNSTPYYDAYSIDGGVPRFRILDRQHWQMVPCKVVVFPTGDVRVAERASPEKIAEWKAQGCIIMQRPMRRVRWTVCTYQTCIFDDWSPFDHFTIVPYFPKFRRGKTRGMVNDLIGPQELLNKSVVQALNIINGTSSSGWLIEQNSLTGNIDTDDLETEGASPGLVLEYRKGSKAPEKIKPNEMPPGLRDIIAFASEKMKAVSGQTDQARAEGGKSQSGRSVMAQQFGAQLSLALALSNLSRTRHMLVRRMIKLIQSFYDNARVYRITESDARGNKVTAELPINQPQEDGTILNNLTIGEYDVVVADQPSQVTFENGQFQQALEMRTAGIALPDDVLVRYSNLADKGDIVKRMQEAGKANPLQDAQIKKLLAEAGVKNVEALFSSLRAAQLVATVPQAAGLADTIARSAGIQDQDAAPFFPEPAAADAVAVPPAPNNTNPATPDNPGAGMNTGIEAGPAGA